MAENVNERLMRDYREMLKIQNRPYLSWIATKGEPPCAREYLLTVNLRTYALLPDGGAYTVGAKRQCTVRMALWDSYPYVAPSIRMLDIPPVFHPDWYSKGTYCSSLPWRPDSSLKDYVKRMLMTLQYQPDVMEIKTPANYKAMEWYERRRGDAGLFPSDTTELTENSDEEVAALEKAAAVFREVVDIRGVR